MAPLPELRIVTSYPEHTPMDERTARRSLSRLRGSLHHSYTSSLAHSRLQVALFIERVRDRIATRVVERFLAASAACPSSPLYAARTLTVEREDEGTLIERARRSVAKRDLVLYEARACRV